MVIIRDERAIQRKGKLGKGLTYSGLGVMAASFLLSLRQTEDFTGIFAIVLLGMIMSQIGIPLFNRYGREPRLDQILDQSLKGLDDRYILIHFLLGADHTLLTPAGTFAIVPSPEKGKILYQDGEWIRSVQKRRSTRQKPLKQLARTGHSESTSLQRALQKHLEMEEPVAVQPLFLFIHSEAELHGTNSQVFATHIKKIKSALRKRPKEVSLSSLGVETLLKRFAEHRD